MDNPRASIEVPVDQDAGRSVERQESEVTVGNSEPRVPEESSERTIVETPVEIEKNSSANVVDQKTAMNHLTLPVRNHAATIA